jgi:hypothetical protein
MNGTAQFKLNYIEVPLLLVVNLTQNLNIHAGPYAAYLIMVKQLINLIAVVTIEDNVKMERLQ